MAGHRGAQVTHRSAGPEIALDPSAGDIQFTRRMKTIHFALLPLLATASHGATIVTNADSFIQRGNGSDTLANTNFGGDDGLIVKNSGATTDTRKIYLLFDLSTITSTITTASIDLTLLTNSGTSTKTLSFDFANTLTYTFNEIDTVENMNTGIDWVNAPNNGSGNALTGNTTYLSGQSIASSVASGTILSYGNAALVNYLNDEIDNGDQQALIIIRRTDGSSSDNLVFYSRNNGAVDGTTIIAPTLNFTVVPEPSALLLSALGSLALLRRKR